MNRKIGVSIVILVILAMTMNVVTAKEIKVTAGKVSSIGNVELTIKNNGHRDLTPDKLTLTIKNVKTGEIVYDAGQLKDANYLAKGKSYIVTWYHYAWSVYPLDLGTCLKNVPEGTRVCPGAPIGTYVAVLTDPNGKEYNSNKFEEKLQTYVVCCNKNDKNIEDYYLLGCDKNGKCGALQGTFGGGQSTETFTVGGQVGNRCCGKVDIYIDNVLRGTATYGGGNKIFMANTGSRIKYIATPDAGYKFSNWGTTDDSPTDNPLIITNLQKNYQADAYFDPVENNLKVEK